jgi:bacteriocin biosynthesis cyclodehydratase domain-containing protein
MDGHNTLDNVLQVVGLDNEDQVLMVIDTLEEQGILQMIDPGEEADQLNRVLANGTAGILQNYEQSLGESSDKLQQATLGVIGDGRLGTMLLDMFAEAGVRALHYFQTGDRSVSGTVTQPADHPGLERYDTLDSFLTRTGAFDLVIVALDAPDIVLLDHINSEALERGFQWHMAIIDGVAGVVGPTIKPYETPCFTCYEMRLIGNMNNREVYLNTRKATFATAGTVPFAGLVAVTAGWACYETLHGIVSGHFFTHGQQLRVNFDKASMEASSLLKLPRCPSCGSLARGKPNRSVYRTFNEVLKEHQI